MKSMNKKERRNTGRGGMEIVDRELDHIKLLSPVRLVISNKMA
jgi:hypothetical protein